MNIFNEAQILLCQGGLHPPGAPEFCSDRSLALGAERYFPQLLLYWVSQAGLFKIGI
jgi:hypothetical protein